MKKKTYPNLKINLHSPLTSKELAILWKIPFPEDTGLPAIELALRERIKELNCLYGVFQLAERHRESINELLVELVNFLPYSWQYPDITVTRIQFRGQTYASSNFRLTKWRQVAPVYMYNELVGEICICYLGERAPSDEGPFMKEERALLNAVAKQIGIISSRITTDLEIQETNRQLTIERQALKESNIALKIVLARIEQEKQEIRNDIINNVDKILTPILRALASQVTATQKSYVEMLERNLQEITSPFISTLSASYNSMTPTEISICNMIRNGMRTKEISEIRGISMATVNHHREKIRRKLRINNSDGNLATFLQSNMWDTKPRKDSVT